MIRVNDCVSCYVDPANNATPAALRGHIVAVHVREAVPGGFRVGVRWCGGEWLTDADKLGRLAELQQRFKSPGVPARKQPMEPQLALFG